MKLDKSLLIELLEEVIDPFTGQSIIKSNRLRELSVQDNQVRITWLFSQNLTTEQKSSINFGSMGAIKREYPNVDVHVHLETQLREGEKEPSVLPQVKNIIAVASGKGGVGKSTVSTNLALGLLQAGYKVGLIDADLYGPSIPTMFGLEGQRPKVKDVHGKPTLIPLDAQGLSVMSIGFIVEPEQAVVLRGPRLAGIMKQFIQDCLWPELDYLIIDLPPGTGDIQLTLVQTVPLTGAILVTTPQRVALVDAIKAMNMFRLPSVNVPILGVIENMSWFSPPELPEKKYFLFGKGGGEHLAKEAESALLGQVPIIEAIREAGDIGIPSVAGEDSELQSIWIQIAQKVSDSVDYRNKMYSPSRIVDIKS